MSEELKNIFDDFDPGVSDEQVEQRWQAIRPLLPKEEGREGIVSLTRKKMLRVLAIAALLVVVSFVSVLFFRKSGPDVIAETKKQEPSISNSRAPSPPPRTERTTVATSQKNNVIASSEKSKPNTERSPDDLVPGQITLTLTPRKRSPIPPVNEVEVAVAEQTNTSAEEPETPAFVSGTNTASDEASTNQITPDEKTALLLPVQYTPPESEEREAITRVSEVRPRPVKLPGKWSVEIFGGADKYNNAYQKAPVTTFATKADDNGSPEYAKGVTWMAGAAAHRSIGRRVFIPVQFIYAGRQNVLSEVNQGSVKITKPVTTTQADSSVLYQNYTDVLEITQQKSMRLGLGLGVRLLASPLFTLNAIALGEVTEETYLRTNNVTFYESETPIPSTQVNTNTYAALNATPPYDPNSRESFRIHNYSATGALHAARRLGPHLAITSRLSYHYSIRESDFAGKYRLISIRPKNLMLSLGLSYHW